MNQLTVALLQLTSQGNDQDANQAKGERFCRRAQLMGADIALFPVDGLPYRGAEADPVAALVFCNPGAVQHLFVEGKPVVHDGQLVNLSEATMIWT